MPNNAKLTLAAFLAYIVTSAMLAPAPLLLAPLTDVFAMPRAGVAPVLGAFNVGILGGAVVAVPILLRVRVRMVLLVAYLLVVAAIGAIALTPVPALVRIALLAAGVACGVGLPAAATLITAVYEGDRRASMLVVTDGAFSLAASLTVLLGGWLLAASLPWAALYGVAMAAAIALLILCVGADFRSVAPPAQRSAVREWPVGIWWCALALAAYTFGQFTMILWLPTYLETTLAVAQEASGLPVARYWMAMFGGQVIAALVVLRVGLQRLALLAGLLTVAIAIPLAGAASLSAAVWLCIAWGLGTLGLLKLTLSLGTEQWQGAPGPVVSTLLLAATLGTALSPQVSGWVVAATSAASALWLACGSLVLALVAIVGALAASRRGDAAAVA
ncbi:MAG: MFS transporter [Pseudomonadota bacterium]